MILKVLTRENIGSIHYPADVDRIIEVMAMYGYVIGRNTAQEAWRSHSDTMCAGWLHLPKSDSELSDIILNHTDVVELSIPGTS